MMTETLTAAHRGENSPIGEGSSAWKDSILPPEYRQYHARKTWTPAINLYESDDSFCVVVDLAGVIAKDIDIHVENGQMTISGQRTVPKMCNPGEQLCLHLMEIDHGQFVRTLAIPGGVSVTNIEAFYRSGYLWVRLPKT